MDKNRKYNSKHRRNDPFWINALCLLLGVLAAFQQAYAQKEEALGQYLSLIHI